MNKTSIELERKDHIFGYGCMNWTGPNYSKDSQDTLDFIVEWSKDNTEKKIYRHLIRTEQQNISQSRFHIVERSCMEDLRIPYCDLVTYLDIYYQ